MSLKHANLFGTMRSWAESGDEELDMDENTAEREPDTADIKPGPTTLKVVFIPANTVAPHVHAIVLKTRTEADDRCKQLNQEGYDAKWITEEYYVEEPRSWSTPRWLIIAVAKETEFNEYGEVGL